MWYSNIDVRTTFTQNKQQTLVNTRVVACLFVLSNLIRTYYVDISVKKTLFQCLPAVSLCEYNSLFKQ